MTELDAILGKHSKLWNYSKEETRQKLLALLATEKRKGQEEELKRVLRPLETSQTALEVYGWVHARIAELQGGSE